MSTLTIDQIVAIRKLSKNDIDFARDIADFVLAKADQRIAELVKIAERELSNTAMLSSNPPKSSAAWNILQALQSPAPVSQPTLADPTHSEQQEPYAYILIAQNGNAANTVFTKEEAENITSMSMFKHLRIVPVWDRPAPHQPSQEQIQEAFKKLSGLSAEEADADREAGHLGKFDYFKEGVEFALQSQTKRSTGSEG